MKRLKRIGYKALMYMLSLSMLCGMLVAPNRVKADTFPSNTNYLSNSEYISIGTQTQSSPGNRQLNTQVLLGGNPVNLGVQNPKIFGTRYIRIQIEQKEKYAVESITFGKSGGYLQTLNKDDEYIYLDLNKNSRNNDLTVSLYAKTQVNVIKKHADGTTETVPAFYLADQKSIEISGGADEKIDTYTASNSALVQKNGEKLTVTGSKGVGSINITVNYYSTVVRVTKIHYDGTTEKLNDANLKNGETSTINCSGQYADEAVNHYTVTNNCDSLIKVSDDRKSLTVTGKKGVPEIDVVIYYNKDTLQITKNYGGALNDGTNDFWIRFDVTGQKQNTVQPLDVVLVLDRSGSMAYDAQTGLPDVTTQSRMAMLQQAITRTNGFIDTLLPTGSVNKISVVDYSSLQGNDGATFSSVCGTYDFSNNSDNLKTYVNNLAAEGGTQTDAALRTVYNSWTSNSLSWRSDSKKIIVLFTDGLPGEFKGCEIGEAFSANAQANLIKASQSLGAQIYSISYIKDNDTRDTNIDEDNTSGSAATDSAVYYDNVTPSMNYRLTVTKNAENSSVLTSPDSSGLAIPVTKGTYHWQYSTQTLAESFLRSVASGDDHFYDATKDIPLGDIFKKVAVDITKVATNAVIEDVMKAANCHLAVGASSSVQYRQIKTDGTQSDSDWIGVDTDTKKPVYYTVVTPPADNKGGTIAFHFTGIAVPGIEIRFRAAPNDGVYSGASGAMDSPDLLTNEVATISYTDINGVAQQKTCGIPKIYIPEPYCEFLSNTVNLNSLVRIKDSNYTPVFLENGNAITDASAHRFATAGTHVITVQAAHTSSAVPDVPDAKLSVYVMEPTISGGGDVFLGDQTSVSVNADTQADKRGDGSFDYAWTKTGSASAMSISSNKLTVTDAPDADTTYTVVITHTRADGTTTSATLTKTARVTAGALTIRKTIDKTYYVSALQSKVLPSQSFIYKIERRTVENQPNADETFYEVVNFGPTGSLSASKTITGLKKGYYTVTEETNWSWKYSLGSPNAITVNIGSIVNHSYYGTKDRPAEVSYINNRKPLNWLGDVAAAINKITAALCYTNSN